MLYAPAGCSYGEAVFSAAKYRSRRRQRGYKLATENQLRGECVPGGKNLRGGQIRNNARKSCWIFVHLIMV